MGRARGRPTPRVQEPEVRVEWVRAEPTPLQARKWERLWQRLLAPEEQPEEVSPSATAIREGDEARDDADQAHSGVPNP
jgi:hypothetical protein